MSEPASPSARLLSLISHELRSPANVLIGSISLLKQDKHGPLTDFQRRLVDQAAQAGARLTELLASLSDLARLEAQTARLALAAVDLHLLTRDVIAGWSCPDGLNVQLILDPSAATTVRADPERLARAIRALIDAHVRAMPDGRLRIAATPFKEAGCAWGMLTLTPEADSESRPPAMVGAPDEFDAFQAGLGFELLAARRLIDDLGGRLAAMRLSTDRAATRVLLPLLA